MIYDLHDFFLNPMTFSPIQFVAETMLLERDAQFSLVDGNVSNHVLVGEIAIHARESIHRLEEQDVVAGQTIISDVVAVSHLADTPHLETLDVS